MTTSRKVEDMVAHAQRHLDGSKVNVNRMAQDVLALADLVERYRAAAGAPLAEEQEPASTTLKDKVSDIFGDVFGDFFKPGKK